MTTKEKSSSGDKTVKWERGWGWGETKKEKFFGLRFVRKMRGKQNRTR